MTKMQVWYEEITAGQKAFLYVLSIILILFFGLGLIPLCALIYLQLGVRGVAQKDKIKIKSVDDILHQQKEQINSISSLIQAKNFAPQNPQVEIEELLRKQTLSRKLRTIGDKEHE